MKLVVKCSPRGATLLEGCHFEGKHEYIGKQPFLKFSGFGSRAGSELYIFNFKTGFFVRAGCYFGPLNAFKIRSIYNYVISPLPNFQRCSKWKKKFR